MIAETKFFGHSNISFCRTIKSYFKLRNEYFKLRNEDFKLRNKYFKLRNKEFSVFIIVLILVVTLYS